ncbi:MAG: hypothetical protein IMW96_05440 [Thermoanaerobacteraceae bacterium]|nr:hypothetical protein [Thermoanaerobacteraceae bacterium]
MRRSTTSQKPRGLLLARGIALAGFAGLALSTLMEGNYFLAALFALLSLYYLNKLLRHRDGGPAPQTEARVRTGSLYPAAAKAELAEMLAYYRRLEKGWRNIAIAGWVVTGLMAAFFRTPFILIILALVSYATYAFLRCRKAVSLIEGTVGRAGET